MHEEYESVQVVLPDGSVDAFPVRSRPGANGAPFLLGRYHCTRRAGTLIIRFQPYLDWVDATAEGDDLSTAQTLIRHYGPGQWKRFGPALE